MASDQEVGKRCLSNDGYFGTVRFIGQVPPTKGEWLGVEWDDPSRGKHSGTHDGIEYFRCRIPNSGSFVRPDKVSLGLDFVQVITERYTYSIDSTGENVLERVSTKDVLLIAGKETQSELKELVNVDLSLTLLSTSGVPQGILNTCPNIRCLNLSSTLISSWNEVALICSQLHLLTTIDLSSNRMTTPTDPLSLLDSLKNVTHLIINKMGLEWNDLRLILQMMANLKQLVASNNNICCLGNGGDSKDAFPESIEEICLDYNKINNWLEVIKLRHLPKLNALFLRSNQLINIEPINKGDFPSLISLVLNDNPFESWCSVDAVASIENLRKLRLIKSPIFKDESELDARLLVIARVPQITYINGCQIYKKERENAEMFYIKKYFPEWIKAKKSGGEACFLSNHKQYKRLSEIHGLPEEESIAKESPFAPTIKDRLLNLTILDVASSKTIKRKLPETMTVQELKSLCMRFFKVKTINQKLYYRSHEVDMLYELENDLKELSFYAVETNDTIEIHTI